MPMDPRELIAKMEWAAVNDIRELIFTIDGAHVQLQRRGCDQSHRDDRRHAPEQASAPEKTPDAAPSPVLGADIVAAPLAGLCHLRPETGDRVFASAGDTVAEGQTLCVIEAMKVMTSVPAPRAGRLEEVLVVEGETVAIGAPLMRLV